MSSGIFNQYTGYHNRQSLRLYGYDYSRPGHYFVTFCVNDHARYFFGDVVQRKMILNEMGVIADQQFEQLPGRFPNIATETYQIMPNHIHAIITIRPPPVGATLAVAPSGNAVAPSGNAVALSGNAVAPSGNAVAPSGNAVALSGNAVALSGNAVALSGNAVALSGNAVALSGNAVALSGNAVAPSGNAVAPSDLSMIVLSDYNGASSRAGASPAPTIVVNRAEQTTSVDSKNITIGDIIGAYKSLVFNNCLEIIKTKNEYLGKLWQRNYYDHIIRDENSLFHIRNYILENPMNWDSDQKNHINEEFNEIEMTEHIDFACQHF